METPSTTSCPELILSVNEAIKPTQFKTTTITSQTPMKPDMELACIGNCACSALIDKKGKISWFCLPRFDGDPVFCSLVKTNTGLSSDIGFFDIKMPNLERVEQAYVPNTAVLVTKMYDSGGGSLEVIDFIPRFQSYLRHYRPTMLVRIIKPLSNGPKAQIRLRPTFGYGWGAPEKTRGSNHIRYVLSNFTIRLTTNAPISYIVDEVLFEIDETIYLVLMPDESLRESLEEMCSTNLARTLGYWRDWAKNLTIPFEWQDEVIRAAITLKLSQFEETGAFISAMTTSIPGSVKDPGYDARYCWPRDALWVTHGLNQLGATGTMEQYLKFIINVLTFFHETKGKRSIHPVYSVSRETRLFERKVHRLPGYRGLGPVVIGHNDCETQQHDVYGAVILALTHMFYDKRIEVQGDASLFHKMESMGKEAIRLFDQPCSTVRTRTDVPDERVFTFAAVMCWAAADKLAKIANLMGFSDRHEFWKKEANSMKFVILEKSWNFQLNSFSNIFGGETVDAYLLMFPRLGLLSIDDPKFLSTFALLEKRLRVKNWFLADEKDSNAHVGATFEYIGILYEVGRKDEARKLFQNVMDSAKNSFGMLAENFEVEKGEMWGNFPNSNSMLGLISTASRLSKHWELAM